jgi:hypothetical protein
MKTRKREDFTGGQIPCLSSGTRRREGRSARAEAKPLHFQYTGSVFRSDCDTPSTSRPLRLAYTHFISQAYFGPPLDPDWEPVLDSPL